MIRGTVQIVAQLIVENLNALAVVRKLLGGHIREVHHLLFPFQMKPKAFAPSASAEWRAGSGNVAMRAGDGGGGSPALHKPKARKRGDTAVPAKRGLRPRRSSPCDRDRKSTRLNSSH